MPVALRRPPGRSRSRWFANYVDLVVDKDVMDISRVRQREMLPRLLGQLAARSGQVLNITPVAGAIGLERSTAENYVKLLEAVFLVHRLPAWGTTLGSRVERGDEVDLVLERDDGQVIAFEIKAGTRVGGEDLHGLRLLKERLGPRLQEAVILYTGQYAYRYEDWAWVLPLSQLWA
jgi:predicted AAA+ superfamily ATPase